MVTGGSAYASGALVTACIPPDAWKVKPENAHSAHFFVNAIRLLADLTSKGHRKSGLLLFLLSNFAHHAQSPAQFRQGSLQAPHDQVLSGLVPRQSFGWLGYRGKARGQRGENREWTVWLAAPPRWRSGRIVRPAATAGSAAATATGFGNSTVRRAMGPVGRSYQVGHVSGVGR